MFVGVHVKYRYSCRNVAKFEYSQHIFESSNTKFNENLSSGSRVVPRERTGRRTDGEG